MKILRSKCYKTELSVYLDNTTIVSNGYSKMAENANHSFAFCEASFSLATATYTHNFLSAQQKSWPKQNCIYDSVKCSIQELFTVLGSFSRLRFVYLFVSVCLFVCSLLLKLLFLFFFLCAFHRPSNLMECCLFHPQNRNFICFRTSKIWIVVWLRWKTLITASESLTFNLKLKMQ